MKIDSNIISSSFVVNAKANPYDIDLKLTLIGGPGELQTNEPDATASTTCLGTCNSCGVTCLGTCRC